MEDFKTNFRNGNDNDLSCKLGCMEEDSQENLINCKVIKEKIDVSATDYFKIFSKNVKQIRATILLLLKALQIRNDLTDLNN